MRIKTVPVKIKSVGDKDGDTEGVFEAIVATYDRDSYGDVIVPGAFKDTLAEWKSSGDPIPVYWSHRMDDPDYNIGQVLEAKETDEGLWVKAQLDLDSPKAQTTHRLMKGRRVTQFSFAYEVVKGAFVHGTDDDDDADEKDGEPQLPYYELRELKLFEVGPTPIGANQETELLDVKTAAGGRVSVLVQGGKAADRAAVSAALGKDDEPDPGTPAEEDDGDEREEDGSDDEKLDEGDEAPEDSKEITLDGVEYVLVPKSAYMVFFKAAGSGGTVISDASKARSDRPAADEEPAGAKSDVPSGMTPANLRLVTSAEMLALD